MPAPPGSRRVLWFAVPPRGARGGDHAAVRYARAFGLDEPPERLTLELPALLRESGQRRARELGLEPGGFVALHPGSGARDKNWAGWQRVSEILSGRPVLVLGGPVEEERGAEFPPGRPVARGLGLLDLAGLLGSSAAFGGNDSGPAHLAAALGVPTVVVFTSTDAAVWAPWSPLARAVLAGSRPVDEVAAEVAERLLG